MRKLPTVFVSGYTRIPKGTKLFEAGTLVGVMFEIDRSSHVIIKAECTFVTHLAQDYFSRMLIGMRFDTQINEIIKTVDSNLYIPSAQSIGVAIKVAHQRYVDHISEEEVD